MKTKISLKEFKKTESITIIVNAPNHDEGNKIDLYIAGNSGNITWWSRAKGDTLYFTFYKEDKKKVEELYKELKHVFCKKRKRYIPLSLLVLLYGTSSLVTGVFIGVANPDTTVLSPLYWIISAIVMYVAYSILISKSIIIDKESSEKDI